ncbi:MAG: 30S ribosomal protein S16 [Patescibacteria group bacterium]|jgi:small subunit ribosomal protein S16
MLAIKLSKVGKTNKKMFRLVVLEKGRDPYGDVLENLGSYNPHSKELVAKADRIKYWLSKGAQMTVTVNNLLVEKKVIEGKKSLSSKSGKPSEKRAAQIKAKADKKNTPAAPVAPAEETTEAVAEKA